MARLFDEHWEVFMNSISHRFRDLSQFLLQGLHNHACIAAQDVVIHTSDDHCHIMSGQVLCGSPDEARSFMDSATHPEIKFLCVNDLPQLEEVFPDVRAWLRGAIGGFHDLPIH